VCDVAAHLDGEDEVIRRGLSPGGESLLRRQMIEAVVELYGIELLGIE
jgi:hypothetical protein